MIKKILFATSNKNKIEEVQRYADDYGLKLITPASMLETVPEVEETASTYIGNAHLKAEVFGRLCPDHVVVADDSGIEVSALDGAPGIHSARFAGPEASHADKCEYLLSLLKTKHDRRACMRSFFCAQIKPGLFIVAEGVWPGTIAHEPRGERGWGYEPVFIPEDASLTVSELKDKGQKLISHRQRAWINLMEGLAA
jgi:XTP/dITP diphosphohydrolase